MNQHILDYYHRIAPALRGTDEGIWCGHQIAALKAEQRVRRAASGRIWQDQFEPMRDRTGAIVR